MEIYLIRHTAPNVDKGVCYGQADIDVTASFYNEVAIIKKFIPANIMAVYSSPLQRCSKLAAQLFPLHTIEMHNELMEINCGFWEMRRWDDIAEEETKPWMDDFVNVKMPGGENYVDLYNRVTKKFIAISQQQKPLALVAHGGVIRSILSYITSTPLIDSFKVFTLHYSCVIKLQAKDGGFQYEVLSNIPHEKETHKPSKH